MGWYMAQVICAPSAQANNTIILDQTTYCGINPVKVHLTHVRFYHPDKTMEDPILRQVLSTRPLGSGRIPGSGYQLSSPAQGPTSIGITAASLPWPRWNNFSR
ncbi:uncharacterized protein N7487_007707 [Penicillium crustosum]|uniref:uncharacterized protein n=1 Tax=Penicillium crustosum TaxID=36656 RepID=UPI002387DEE0|nr:uncharacterized protein N7487_007707 [Penicillium crustosum]KAJ5401811.1 hypothetical protein N7487_007707 [Penicillium crustosum]